MLSEHFIKLINPKPIFSEAVIDVDEDQLDSFFISANQISFVRENSKNKTFSFYFVHPDYKCLISNPDQYLKLKMLLNKRICEKDS